MYTVSRDNIGKYANDILQYVLENFGKKGIVEKLFKENNKDGRFLFDKDEFHDLVGLVGSLGLKAGCCGSIMNHIIKRNYDDDEALLSNAEAEKLFFGKVGIYYLMRHPEVYTAKNYLAKTPDGKFVFGNWLSRWGREEIGSAGETIKNILEKKTVRPLDENELKAYEKSLKGRGMPAYMIEGDVYGMKLYRNKMKALKGKDKKGKVIYMKPSDFPDVDPVTGEELP